MPPLLLDDDEAVAIAVGLRAAAGASIDGIQDTSVRALAKLEQVLPDRLRRRVNAVHSNVMALRWAGSGPTVDSEALAVLAQACRDREEVRFDYQGRDGQKTRRLVQPHQLVSAGRRWYLVAWDVRREGWRTFRVDRLQVPHLGGARFAVRTLPAPDAASFVAASMRSMPLPHEAVVDVHASPEEVRKVVRWSDAEVEPVGEGRCRVRLRADSIGWLVTAIAMVAVHFEVELHATPEVAGRIAELRARLDRV